MSGRDVVRVGGSALLAGWGGLMLARPDAVAAAVAGPDTPPPEVVVRVLGARRVVQHLAVALVASRGLALLGAGVDAVHAASMVGAAALWPQYRRAALTSAAVATTAAVLTAVSAPRHEVEVP